MFKVMKMFCIVFVIDKVEQLKQMNYITSRTCGHKKRNKISCLLLQMKAGPISFMNICQYYEKKSEK